MMKINFLDFTRRQFMKTAAIAAAAGAAPSALVSEAFASTEEERIIAAAKKTQPCWVAWHDLVELHGGHETSRGRV